MGRELELTQPVGDGEEKSLTAWEDECGSMIVLGIHHESPLKLSEQIGYHLSPDQRRQLLTHLLEAEAAERAEIREDKHGNQWVTVDGKLYLVHYSYGRVFTTVNADECGDPKEEDWERLALGFAALAEKRKREADHD